MTIRIREKTSREEWLQWRRENINASEAAVMLDHDKFQTRLGLYFEKKLGITQAEKRVMARGRHMEAAVLSMVAEERPSWTIKPCKDYYDDPDLRIGCSPDAFVWSDEWEGHANLQIKVVGRPIFEADWRDDDGGIYVPIHYQNPDPCRGDADWGGAQLHRPLRHRNVRLRQQAGSLY